MHVLRVGAVMGLAAALVGCAAAGQVGGSDAAPGRDAAPSRDAARPPDDGDVAPYDGVAPADAMSVPDGGCPAGRTECGGFCVDTDTDPANCGACGHPCGVSEVCMAGGCVLSCPTGQIVCSGVCVDPSTDLGHCGGCGHACTAGQRATPVCEGGLCGVHCDPGWSDLDNDGTCETECVPSGSETCNGQDDDCNGVVDDGFSCVLGATVSCTTSCGSSGSGTCAAGCTLPGPGQCVPPQEVCNGQDDDCDGACDDGFGCCAGASEACTTSCGTTGSRTCSGSCQWSACVPPQEVCNGQDDDCDGACDDGFGCCAGASEACTTSCGSTGSRTCSGSCQWSACVPPQEVCNGQDDDCDGATDEDFVVYDCGLTGGQAATQSACDAACSVTNACTPESVGVSGSVTLRDCDWNGDCNPSYFLGKLEGSGSAINVYREGFNGSFSLLGSIMLSGATASGSVTLRDCDWNGDCNPSYFLGKLEGSGSAINVYREGFNGSFSLLGSIMLSGATASGSVTLRDCDWNGDCNPSYFLGKLEGSGSAINVYREGSNGLFTSLGAITLSSTSYQCPLGSGHACSGSPPSCSASETCQAVVECP